MKKLIVIISVSILALVGCSKHDTATNSGQIKYIKVTVPASPQTRTTVDGNAYTTSWQAGDAIRMYIKTTDGTVSDYKFTADNGGGSFTSFTGEIPESMVGNVTSVAACYPYSEQLSYKWESGWEISETFMGDNLAQLSSYDVICTPSTEASMEYTDQTQSEAELTATMNFKPLLARIRVTIPSQYDFDVFTLTADKAVFPSHGTIDLGGNFTAAASRQELTFAPASKDFYIGILPFSGTSTTISATFRQNGQWPMKGKTFSVSEFKPNTFYTLDITSATAEPYELNVSDAVDSQYGTNTADAGKGVFEVDDPTGAFDGWSFYFAEIKKAGNDARGDILNDMNRIQMQVNGGSGAFCTAPIYFTDKNDLAATQKVRVSFTAATNNTYDRSYIIGGFKTGIDITPASLNDEQNYSSYVEDALHLVQRADKTHEFTITNGQRIAFSTQRTTLIGAHIELGNFKIEFIE